MSNCHYSIVPKPGQTLTCSKCHKKIEDLPYYTQMAQMYKCIQRKNDVSLFVGLGLGVPMCDDCDEYVDDTIEKTKKKYRYISIGCCVILMMLLSLARDSDVGPGLIVPLIFVGIGVYIVLKKNENEEQGVINEKLEENGLNVIKGPLDYFKKRGWQQEMGNNHEVRDYTVENLQVDLEKLCNGGIYCVLNNDTGMIVDHRDPEEVKNIYYGSLWKYSYE